MKIIAKKNKGYILEASNDEVANLLGMYSYYGNEMPKENDEIDIKGLYDKYKNGEYLRSKQKDLEALIKILTIASSELDAILPKEDGNG